MRRWLLVFMLVLTVVTPLVPSGSAEAAPFARNRWEGYFTGVFDQYGGDVIQGGIWPAFFPLSPTGQAYVESFIALMLNHLAYGNGQDRTGAEFLVLTMMGWGPGTWNGVAHDPAFLNDWMQRVRYYSDNGWLQFNVPASYSTNTYYQGLPSGPNPYDDAWFFENGSTPYAIVFHKPGGGFYVIRQECANPVGDNSPLEQPAYQLVGDVQPGASTPAFGSVIQAGGTYNLSPTVTNLGPAGSTAATMFVGNLSPAYVSNAGISSPGGYDSYWEYGPSCLAATACWQWQYWASPYLPPGVTSTQTNGATFTVSPTTPDGTSVCFNVTIAPSNQNGAVTTGPPRCFTVLQPRYPQLIGNSGDVHAGGGVCGQAQSTGSVTGHAKSQSLSEYVVSANGAVTNFGSNNTVAGTNATLGRTGSYYSICRPDLVATAQAYFLSGQPYTALPGGTFTMATLPASATGIYIHNGGGNLTLSGNFSRKITIVSLTGTVTINGNITLTAAAALGSSAPSLGIISAGDIIINGAATRVDAYLFSNGTINTCAEGNAAACRNTLDVNGFLMSRNLSFRRLGPVSAALQVAGERINLSGQIYLNPPKFFDVAGNLNLLQNQGEKPPLN